MFESPSKGILYKCQSADGSRDFPVTEVRQLPGDQNVYWATMRTLGLSREEVKALSVKCVPATPRSEPVQSAATSAAHVPRPGQDGAAITMNETSYRVNPEFAAAFKDTGGAAETVAGVLSDMSYGSPIARTEAGVHEIMDAYRCDDPVIKQFESGLLQMHAAHMTGARAR